LAEAGELTIVTGQLVDYVNSQTANLRTSQPGQVTDWTAHGLVNWWTGHSRMPPPTVAVS